MKKWSKFPSSREVWPAGKALQSFLSVLLGIWDCLLKKEFTSLMQPILFKANSQNHFLDTSSTQNSPQSIPHFSIFSNKQKTLNSFFLSQTSIYKFKRYSITIVIYDERNVFQKRKKKLRLIYPMLHDEKKNEAGSYLLRKQLTKQIYHLLQSVFTRIFEWNNRFFTLKKSFYKKISWSLKRKKNKMFAKEANNEQIYSSRYCQSRREKKRKSIYEVK